MSLEIQLEVTELEVGNVIVEVVEVGVQGPPGTGGGGESTTIYDQEFLVLTAGAQSFDLDFVPNQWLEWFINGLRNKTALFTLASRAISIPATVGLEPGDTLTFSYTI